MSDFAPFWMICRKPNNANAATFPKTRYRTKAEALTAAQRLADTNGHPFLVLETVEACQPQSTSNSLFSLGDTK